MEIQKQTLEEFLEEHKATETRRRSAINTAFYTLKYKGVSCNGVVDSIAHINKTQHFKILPYSIRDDIGAGSGVPVGFFFRLTQSPPEKVTPARSKLIVEAIFKNGKRSIIEIGKNNNYAFDGYVLESLRFMGEITNFEDAEIMATFFSIHKHCFPKY